MLKLKPQYLGHKAFQFGVALKGLDGLVETVGGIALLLTSKPAIEQLVRLLTQNELSEDPSDFVANLLIRSSQRLSTQTQHFAGFYLLGYGVIKLGMAVCLLRGLRWSYPVALVILTLFVAYQIFRIAHTHSVVLLLLTLLDSVIVLLIFREWHGTRPHIRGSECLKQTRKQPPS